MIDPNTLGHWEDDTFVFDEPFDMGGGRVMRRLLVEPGALAPGVSRDDAVHALVNSIEDPLPDPTLN